MSLFNIQQSRILDVSRTNFTRLDSSNNKIRRSNTKNPGSIKTPDKKRGESSDLISATGVLELARVEPRAAAEEVVNLAGFDVVREARDEESLDPLLLWLGVDHRRSRRMRRVGLLLLVVVVVGVRVKVVGLGEAGGLDDRSCGGRWRRVHRDRGRRVAGRRVGGIGGFHLPPTRERERERDCGRWRTINWAGPQRIGNVLCVVLTGNLSEDSSVGFSAALGMPHVNSNKQTQKKEVKENIRLMEI